MTLILVPQHAHRLREFDDRERFAEAMHQVPGAPRCEVVIQGSTDKRTWFDLETFWAGAWSGDVPTPTYNDVAATAAANSLRYARHIVRAQV